MHLAYERASGAIESLRKLISVDMVEPAKGFKTSLYFDVLEHRKKYYAISAKHLLAQEELNKESFYDSHSVIFVAKSESGILSTLRLTPRPFELETLQSHSIDFSLYDQHLEVGRLVTDPTLDHLTSAMVVKFLLCSAGLYAFEKQKAEGLVAICRPFRTSFFTKFGLQSLGDVYSEERKIYYRFLAGHRDVILQHAQDLQENNASVFDRIQKRMRASFAKTDIGQNHGP